MMKKVEQGISEELFQGDGYSGDMLWGNSSIGKRMVPLRICWRAVGSHKESGDSPSLSFDG